MVVVMRGSSAHANVVMEPMECPAAATLLVSSFWYRSLPGVSFCLIR